MQGHGRGFRPRSIVRLCKKFNGDSIPNLITHSRLDKAEALLKHSDTPITQIAFEVGFKDANYFSTVFKKNRGMTPKAYRVNCK